jgi:hypothetical protein
MPDERQPLPDAYEPALREAGQARTDLASIESDLEFLMRRVNHLPTASDLWRTALLIALIGGAGAHWAEKLLDLLSAMRPRVNPAT